MYVYLVVNKLNDYFTYNELVAVCATEQIAEKQTRLFKMDGNRKASVEIVRKRVNSKSIVYILESLYDLCGVSGYFFEEVNTSKKRLDGYVKHICQTQQANANDFRIKEMQVLQA